MRERGSRESHKNVGVPRICHLFPLPRKNMTPERVLSTDSSVMGRKKMPRLQFGGREGRKEVRFRENWPFSRAPVSPSLPLRVRVQPPRARRKRPQHHHTPSIARKEVPLEE